MRWTAWTEGSTPLGTALARVARAALGIVLGASILQFVRFREDPLFWIDGLQSEWFQHLVDVAFYPLVCLQVCLLLRMSCLSVMSELRYLQSWVAEEAVILMLWGTLGTCLVFTVDDNLTNLVEGRPFHSHAAEFGWPPSQR